MSTNNTTTTRTAADIKGGDTILEGATWYEVFDTYGHGAKVTIRVIDPTHGDIVSFAAHVDDRFPVR